VISLALLGLAAASSAVEAQKICIMGAMNKCGKGMVCISPHHEPMPGEKGICAKECTSGVEGTCPMGSMCWTGEGAEPGAKGGCVKDSMCYPLHHMIDEAEHFIAHGIVEMYENVLDMWYKHLFDQIVDGYMPTECAGPEHMMCKEGYFCLEPPHSIDPMDLGHCFKGHKEWVDGDCISGTEDPCGEGMMCMTPPDSPMGAEGECVPMGSKACVAGMKGCAKGYHCEPLETGHPAGYCKKTMPCDDEMMRFQNIQYYQFMKLATDYMYSDAEVKMWVKKELKA